MLFTVHNIWGSAGIPFPQRKGSDFGFWVFWLDFTTKLEKHSAHITRHFETCGCPQDEMLFMVQLEHIYTVHHILFCRYPPRNESPTAPENQGHIRLGEILCRAVDFSLQRWKKAMHLIYVLQ